MVSHMRPLSEELAKKAATELNEKPDQIHTNLTVIRQWLQKMPHINARTDDQFLLIFLRSCKYRLESVKEKLDMFYTVRTALPKIIGKRDPLDEKTQKIVQLGQQIFLPKTQTPDGPRIVIHRAAAVDPKVYSIEEALHVAIMINDVFILADDNLVISGAVVIIDVANLSLDHILQLTPTIVKQLTLLSQEASPFRHKASHYINTPASFEMGFNMFRKLLSEKARSRIHVHKTLESLYEYVPKALLPKEYGGDAGSISDLMADTNKRLLAHREYLLEDHKFCVDESKRPGKPKTVETLFGVEGSFRSLSVD